MNRHFNMLLRVLLALVCCACFILQSKSLALAQDSINIRHGNRNLPRIALTIDDCYDRQYILEAIELCEEYHVAMTFFPIGNALKFADGSLWQRALDAGCEIGNHTWGHKKLTELNTREIHYQLLRTQQKIDEMLGYHYPMQVMRPPYGNASKKVNQVVEALGYNYVVRWDVSQTNADKALKSVENGSILLYHARSKDIQCLRSLIPKLLSKGYQCVTVSELMGLSPVAISKEIYIYKRGELP